MSTKSREHAMENKHIRHRWDDKIISMIEEKKLKDTVLGWSAIYPPDH